MCNRGIWRDCWPNHAFWLRFWLRLSLWLWFGLGFWLGFWLRRGGRGRIWGGGDHRIRACGLLACSTTPPVSCPKK